MTCGCLPHKYTDKSSCQVEVHSINEAIKTLLSLKLLFWDINHLIAKPIVNDDNQVAVMCSKGAATK